MNSMAVCRTCMSPTSLNPIFPCPEAHERFSNAIFLISGVQVKINDNLPQQICITCLKHINNSIKFRAKCKETEEILLRLTHGTFHVQNSNVEEKNMEVDYSIGNIKQEIDEDDYDIKTELDRDDNDIDNYHDKPLSNVSKTQRNDKSISEKDMSLVSVKSENDYNYSEYDTDKSTLINNFFEQGTGFDKTNNMEENLNNNAVVFDNIKIKKGLDTDLEEREKLYVIDLSNPTGKRVTCKLCQKNLSIRSIGVHLTRSHPGVDGRRAKCKMCERRRMDQHRLDIHGKDTFQCWCEECGSAFNSRRAVAQHGRVHRGQRRARPRKPQTI